MADWKKNPKSMNLDQLKSYKKELESGGHTGKEYGKVINLIKTLEPNKYDDKTVANAYKSLSSGVTKAGGWTEQNAENIYKYTGTRPTFTQDAQGNPLGGGSDLSSQLSGYQDSVYGASSTPEVRDSIINQIEPEGGMPDTIDWSDMYDDMRGDLGVTDLEESLNTLNDQLQTEMDITEERTLDAEGKPVAMGVISGRVSEIERQQNTRIRGITRQIDSITNQLNTAYNVINTYMQFERMEYQDAMDKYNTEFNRNLKIYELTNAELDRNMQMARANLQLYMNAITSGNMSYSSLSGEQKAMISKLEAQSGLPIGFISGLKLNPKDSILGMSSDNTQAWVIGEDGNLNVIPTGLKASGSGGSSSESKDVEEFYKVAEQEIENLRKGEPWESVFRRMRNRFPYASNDAIDIALGGSGGGVGEKDDTGWAKSGAYEDWKARTDATYGI